MGVRRASVLFSIAAIANACTPPAVAPPHVETANVDPVKLAGRRLEDGERDGTRLVRRTKPSPGGTTTFEAFYDKELDTECTASEQSRATEGAVQRWMCLPRGSAGAQTLVFGDPACKTEVSRIQSSTTSSWVTLRSSSCASENEVYRIRERRPNGTIYRKSPKGCVPVTGIVFAGGTELAVVERLPNTALVMLTAEDAPIDDELAVRWLVSPDGARIFHSLVLPKHGNAMCSPEAVAGDTFRCLPASDGYRPDPVAPEAPDFTDYAERTCQDALARIFDDCHGRDQVLFLREERACRAEEIFRLAPSSKIYRRAGGESADDAPGTGACVEYSDRDVDEERDKLKVVGASIPMSDFPAMKIIEVPIGDGRIVDRRASRAGVSMHQDFWDRTLAQTVFSGIAEDGKRRWLAGTSDTGSFADAACSMPAARILCSDPEVSRYAVRQIDPGCKSAPRASTCAREMFTLGEEITTVWKKNAKGECTKEQPDGASSPWQYRKLGAKVDPSTLVRAPD